MTDKQYFHSFHNRDRLVLIMDNDPETCEALTVLFRLDGFQTRSQTTSLALETAIAERTPDVLVMNLMDNGRSTLPVLQAVKAMRLGICIFMLSDDGALNSGVEAMKAGAVDVVAKPVDSEKLSRAVRDALRRDVHLGAVQGGRRPIEIRGFNQLTPREREVLQLISNGNSNKEAGRELSISPRTVEVHRARVMEKLGARNTADLLRIVLAG